MRERELSYCDDDQMESTINRPRSSAPKHASRQQFSYARGRKRSTTHFNGLHRRRSNKWTW